MRLLSVRLRIHFVANAPYRFDIRRTFCRVIQLFTQIPDMNHDGVGIMTVVFFSPNLLEQFLGADHLSSVLTQEPEDRKFGRREWQKVSVQEAFVGVSI